MSFNCYYFQLLLLVCGLATIVGMLVQLLLVLVVAALGCETAPELVLLLSWLATIVNSRGQVYAVVTRTILLKFWLLIFGHWQIFI